MMLKYPEHKGNLNLVFIEYNDMPIYNLPYSTQVLMRRSLRLAKKNLL